MLSNEVEIKTYEEYQNLVISSSKPVILDFSAEWCRPCKQLKPILDSAVASNGGSWILACVDVDIADQQISEQLKVTSIPAVYLFKNGKVIQQFVGFDKTKITDMITMAQA